MSRLVQRWLLGVWVISWLLGCGGMHDVPDARVRSDGGRTSDAVAWDASVDPGLDGGTGCLDGGRGEIRVMLDVPPEVNVDPSQVWVAAMCLLPDGDGGVRERAVRVVRWDFTSGSDMTVLAGLGPGYYIVRASAGLWPSVESSRLFVDDRSVVVTHLALGSGARPLAILRVGDAGGARADAGWFDAAARDGSSGREAGSLDAATSSDWVIALPIHRAGSTQSVGVLEARLQPRDEAAFDVEVSVRGSECTECVRLTVAGVEIRVGRRGEPYGMAVAPFGGSGAVRGEVLVPPGSGVLAPRRTLPGTLGDPDLGISVALFGTIAEGDAGLAPR